LEFRITNAIESAGILKAESLGCYAILEKHLSRIETEWIRFVRITKLLYGDLHRTYGLTRMLSTFARTENTMPQFGANRGYATEYVMWMMF